MILVLGATGRLGGAITQRLLARGERVRVLLRRDSMADRLATQGLATAPSTLTAAGAEPVYGDLKDPASLHVACRDADVVITTANSALRGGADNPESVDRHGSRNLIEAARDARVRQFVYVSAQLADPQSPVPFLRSKGKTEEALQHSGVPYTILAPNAFMDVWIAMVVGIPALSGGEVVVVGRGDRKHSFIAAADVAAFAVASVGNPAALHQKLVLGGPEPLSFRDAAAIFARVLGRDVRVRSVEPGTPMPHLPETMAAMLAGFDRGDRIVDMSEIAPAFNVSLTRLEQFARQMAGS
jgi:NADH dehydrogenase